MLAGFAQPILQCCAQCLGTYQEINMVILSDTLASVLEACKYRTDIVRHPDFLNMIMPPLIARWNAVDAAAPPGSGGGDPHQFKPLLEGLTSVAVAVGPAFEPFAPPVFKKCLDIIETTLIVMLSGHDGMGAGVGDPMEMGDYIDFDPMCVSLDLVAGIAEGVVPHARPCCAQAIFSICSCTAWRMSIQTCSRARLECWERWERLAQVTL